MSHFTHIKTSFNNLFYLEQALNFLDIKFLKEKKKIINSSIDKESLKLSELSGYDLEFVWTGKEYEILVDMSFWNQFSPIKLFMDKIAYYYACQTVIGESRSLGFEYRHSHLMEDGSNIVILEKWRGRLLNNEYTYI